MKAYKATFNLKCRDQTYVIGEIYTSDKLKICKSGFHFCNNMSDVLNYYLFDNRVVNYKNSNGYEWWMEHDKRVMKHIIRILMDMNRV